MKQQKTKETSIVLFDGLCHLCSGAVQFLIRHDPHRHFKFASLQSDIGRLYLEKHVELQNMDSLILVEKGRNYTESTAVLRVTRRLSGVWPLCSALLIIPSPLRDWAYRWIARRRYQRFGQRTECLLPSPELKDRFLS